MAHAVGERGYGDRGGQSGRLFCANDVAASLRSQNKTPFLPSAYVLSQRQHGIKVCSQYLFGSRKTSLTNISRNPYSSIHPRDPRSSSSLFDNYPGADTRSRPASSESPARPGYGYGGSGVGSPYMNGGAQAGSGGFRPATPNSKYVHT